MSHTQDFPPFGEFDLLRDYFSTVYNIPKEWVDKTFTNIWLMKRRRDFPIYLAWVMRAQAWSNKQ